MKKISVIIISMLFAVLSGTATFGADITSDLIGKFTFDENVINEVTGEEAITVEKGNAGIIGEPIEGKWNYTDGVNGQALILNEELERSSRDEYFRNTNGLKLLLAPSDGKNYTVSVWCKAIGASFVNTVVWIGSEKQKPENWVAIDTGFTGDYNTGPIISSNDHESNRFSTSLEDGMGLGALKNSEKTTDKFDWTNITMVVENGIGKLYYDGQFITDTGKNSDGEYLLLPDVLIDDTVSFYLGANCYDEPFSGYVDELYIYDRALTEEDIKELVEETNVANVEFGEFESYEQTTQIDYLKPPNNHIFPYHKSTDNVKIWDDILNLEDDQLEKLFEYTKKIADKHNINICINIEDTFSGLITVEEDAKNFYELFYEEGADGISIVIIEDTNDCEIYVSGSVNASIAETYGIDKMEEEIEKKLERKGLDDAANLAVRMINSFEKEADFLLPYNYLNPYKSSSEIFIELILKMCIIVAAIAIFRKVFLKKTMYHTGRKADEKQKGGVCVHCASFYDSLTEDMNCPFCDKNDFMYGKFKKLDLPDKAGSFVLDKKDFIEMYKKFVKGFKFYPYKLQDEIHEDDIRAVYLNYNKEEVVLDEREGIRYGWGDTKRAYYRKINDSQYIYLKNISNLPHMSSRKIVDRIFLKEESYIPEELLKKIEPFVGEKEDKLKEIVLHKENSDFYAPLWRMDIKYGKKLYTFLMNAQNGQIAGEIIISKFKWWLLVCAGSVVVYAIMSVIFNLLALL